jgi:glutathione S-transferase
MEPRNSVKVRNVKIWGRANSSNVQKVVWVCREAGIQFDRENVGGEFGRTKDADMLARNPNARVPTIEDNGLVLWESNAIVRYLAAKYAMGSLCPEDLGERADADRWMDWQQTTVMGFMTPIFWGRVRDPEAFPEEQIQAAIGTGIETWQILEARLQGRDWIMGDRFTMADIPLGPMVRRWFELVDDRPAMPAFEAWFERLKTRPAFDQAVMQIPMT